MYFHKDKFLAIDVDYYNNKKEFFDNLSASDMSYTKSKEFLKSEELLASNEEYTIARVDKSQGVIPIIGELVVSKDPCSVLSGYQQTSYSDILFALSSLENNPDIEEITLAIDSPGGMVSGLLEVMNRVKSISKPTKAIIGSQGCSAAYFLASQADTILAKNALSAIGSVGVIASFMDASEAMKKAGYKPIIITSTDAPEKYTDPSTDKGQAKIKNQIDEIHAILAKEVSIGRNITVEEINSNFGKGGVFLSEKAQENGMIDGVLAPTNVIKIEDKIVASENKESNKTAISETEMALNKKEVHNMDKKEFKTSQPELFSEVFDSGVKAERERVQSLTAWTKANPETSEVVERAIAQGHSAEKIMPELMAVIKTGFGSLKAAEQESPEDLAQAQSKAASGSSKIEDEFDIDVDAIADEAFNSIIF